ncbi:MAG: alpha/beta hydrolase [Aureliella sp.]
MSHDSPLDAAFDGYEIDILAALLFRFLSDEVLKMAQPADLPAANQRPSLLVRAFFFATGCFAVFLCSPSQADENFALWPDLAPGETTREAGTELPRRDGETPPITRIEKITSPTFTVHRPKPPNGTGVVILPGGGFGKVVPGLEGTEAADWLAQQGITSFVVSYRTTTDSNTPGWKKPLQDAQRMIARVRHEAKKYELQVDRIGLLGFSAGGQVAARLLSDRGNLAYQPLDAIDKVSHRPNFAILVYPWRMFDANTEGLAEGISVRDDCPPTFLVHTHDDASTSLGAVLFYAGLKKHSIASELHIYGNGGHGYGLRPRPNSQISSWTDHASHWLSRNGW